MLALLAEKGKAFALAPCSALCPLEMLGSGCLLLALDLSNQLSLNERNGHNDLRTEIMWC